MQHLKAPHFRNAYTKVGMFGSAFLSNTLPHQDTTHQGDQIRGFGFLHDGGHDTIFRFIQIAGFSDLVAPGGFPASPEGDPLRRDVEAFILAFDSNLAPIVGQQITLGADSVIEVGRRINLLIERAEADECELVVITRPRRREHGYLYVAHEKKFVPSERGKPALTDAQLRRRALLSPLTYTCVPTGSGRCIALDADLDGCYNLTELEAGYHPRDPSSTPPGC